MDKPPSLQRIQAYSLLTLAAIAVGAALHWLTPVMVPFMLAFFMSVLMTPIVEGLHQKVRLPRLAALMIAILFGVVIIAGMTALVAESVGELEENKTQYLASFDEARLDLAALLGVEDDALIEQFRGKLHFLAGSAANALLGVMSQVVLVIIFMMFLVSGRTYSGTLGDVERRIKGYVSTKLLVSGVTGLGTWLILSALQIEMALVFGLLAFLLNFIPSVGSVIATLLPLPVVLVGQDYGVAQQVLAIVLPGAVQFSVGNILEPKLLGDSMSLHPVTILLALIFWGMIWGFVGTLLATPVTAVVRILLDKLPETRPVANLMAGRLPGDGDGP